MQATETIPLFRTRSTGGVAVVVSDPQPVANDPAPLPTVRLRMGKPALPVEKWVDFATLREALQAQRRLSAQHATVCGLDKATGRYYVRGYGWQWA